MPASMANTRKRCLAERAIGSGLLLPSPGRRVGILLKAFLLRGGVGGLLFWGWGGSGVRGGRARGLFRAGPHAPRVSALCKGQEARPKLVAISHAAASFRCVVVPQHRNGDARQNFLAPTKLDLQSPLGKMRDSQRPGPQQTQEQKQTRQRENLFFSEKKGGALDAFSRQVSFLQTPTRQQEKITQAWKNGGPRSTLEITDPHKFWGSFL